MSTIIYGHTKEQIAIQKVCKHANWYGPCIDSISRYYKCLDCFCLDRDLTIKEAKEHYEPVYIEGVGNR